MLVLGDLLIIAPFTLFNSSRVLWPMGLHTFSLDFGIIEISGSNRGRLQR